MMSRVTGKPHPKFLMLRPALGETYLSMYRAAECTAEEVAREGDRTGAGVARFNVGTVRQHFEVFLELRLPVLGPLDRAHPAVLPNETEDGQISLEHREWLANCAEWISEPDR